MQGSCKHNKNIITTTTFEPRLNTITATNGGGGGLHTPNTRFSLKGGGGEVFEHPNPPPPRMRMVEYHIIPTKISEEPTKNNERNRLFGMY